MIINYTAIMSPHWEERKSMGHPQPFNFTPSEYMEALLGEINKRGADGYRFNGIITSPLMSSGGAFLFEKLENKKLKYTWKFDDEVTKYVNIQQRKGGIPNDTEIIKLYDNMGDIHAVVSLPEISERLVFFVAITEDEESGNDTLDLYAKFESNTGKKAVWQGRETKGFIAWKDMYDRNQLNKYER